MASNYKNKATPKRKSKRDKRMRIMVYIMIAAMLLSSMTAGLSFIL